MRTHVQAAANIPPPRFALGLGLPQPQFGPGLVPYKVVFAPELVFPQPQFAPELVPCQRMFAPELPISHAQLAPVMPEALGAQPKAEHVRISHLLLPCLVAASGNSMCLLRPALCCQALLAH